MNDCQNKYRSKYRKKHSGAPMFLSKTADKFFGASAQSAEPLSCPQSGVSGDFSVRKAVWDEYMPPLAHRDDGTDVSIIISAENCEGHISDCIDSVFNQTAPCGIEIIIVNCGSTDGTAAILEKYKVTHGITVADANAANAAAANNIGLTYASGKYVMFLNAADILLPEALGLMLSKARAVDADIVQGAWQGISASDQKPCVHRCANRLFTHGKKAVNAANSCFAAPWAKLFKRSLFKKIRFSQNGDMDGETRLSKSVIASVSDCVYLHNNA